MELLLAFRMESFHNVTQADTQTCLLWCLGEAPDLTLCKTFSQILPSVSELHPCHKESRAATAVHSHVVTNDLLQQ